MSKKVIFSGIQPTGVPTLGNYLGAFKNWTTFQTDFLPIYCIVDLHAITIRQNPSDLFNYTKNLIALFIASGLNPDKNIIYCQSHISFHSELAWILNCFSYMGELSRMVQFKDKSEKMGSNIPVGLFDYPVLQASDILLYQTNLVPVGADQRQHIELTRDIAIRFNNIFGDIFTIPEVFVSDTSSKIMGLQNPTKKMSKSDCDNPNNVISLLDDIDLIVKKVKRSVTDSENSIRFDQNNKPGISNLLNIYSAITNTPIDTLVSSCSNMNYGSFKELVAQAIVSEIAPIQAEFNKLIENPDYLFSIIKNGSKKAYDIAFPTIQKVKSAVGFFTF